MDGPPTRMMYSPDAGAPCELRANIDKNETSKRRLIVIGERTIYAAGEIAQVVATIGDGGGPASTIPATTDRSPRASDPPTFAVFESAQTDRHERGLPPAGCANCSWKPLRTHTRRRS